ncbi:50S ribosomal protein L29 [bacterium NHP-B]|nr:50S ribosomal protein L29 [bacterium NHP-B]
MTVFLELMKKSATDLRAEYHALAREEMNLRFQHAAKQLKNTSSLRHVKRKKARVKTALCVILDKKG